MSPAAGGVSTERPVILGVVSAPRSIKAPSGGGGRVNLGGVQQRVDRLDARFEDLAAAFGNQIRLAESIQSTDPQLVLVLEARDEQVDLTRVAKDLNIEVLVETESRVDPDEEFALKSAKPRIPLVSSCLHALCVNATALDELLGLWRAWKRDGSLPRGRAQLRDLFVHLKDVRPWGPEDRLQMIDWDEHFAGQDPDSMHSIDLELWYRRSPAARTTAQEDVTTLLTQAGGSVTSSVVIDQIGYHGLKATVSNRVLEALARRDFDAVQVVKSANVMYLKVSGQIASPAMADTDEDVTVDLPAPVSPPVVCLFDGVPATNHPLLADRVTILDPDDLASGYTVKERRHGTAMSSAVVWGDRSRQEDPSARQILVRPILIPSDETINHDEELPADALAPDLMWRAFRDLFEPGADGSPPAAPDIVVVNLSVGDPAAPFDTVLSAWARMIDWLSYEYGVLVVVSAGNHTRLDLTPLDSGALAALSGDARRQATLEAIERQQGARRLLAPAESINALTVAATHDDGAGPIPLGYRIDPNDGLTSISPISATGSGYRRSIKPEVAAPGGRAFFVQASQPTEIVKFRTPGELGPGIKVASPNVGRETYTVGTSVAAALVSRQAGRLHDVVEQVTAGTTLTRRQRAVAIKALLVHGAGDFDDLSASPMPLERAVGNGVLLRDFSSGCAENEAVLLFLGRIGATQEQELTIPLPDGLNIREAKRIEASLAWLSPTNWRHRQYRRAALSFVAPSGAVPPLGSAVGLPADVAKGGATTVQRQVWETNKAFAEGQGSSITIRVKCYEQAGGLDGITIDYAAAVSIWVAPTVGVDVYTQVRDQLRLRVPVQPTP